MPNPRRTWIVSARRMSTAFLLSCAGGICWIHTVRGQTDERWRTVHPRLAPAISIDEQRAKALGLERFSGPNLTLYTDLRQREDVRNLPEVFAQAIPQIARYFRVDPHQASDWHLTGAAILDPARFREAGLFPADLPDFLAGYQRGSQLWVYQQQGEYYLRHLALHEAVHGFMSQFLGGTGPPWYTEGIAELVALHRWENGQLVLPADPRSRDAVPYWGRIRLLRDAQKAGQTKTLDEVFAIPGSAFRQVESYAWAWAVCKFLQDHPLSRAAFALFPDHVAVPAEEAQAWFREQLQDALPQLRWEWLVFLQEMDYGYDVAAMASRDAQTVGTPAESTEAIAIDSRFGWQRSPWTVTAGEEFAVEASGEFQIGADGGPWLCQPGGITLEYHQGRPLGRLLARVLPNTLGEFPTEPPQVLEVGTGATLTAPQAGTLWFRLNDSPAKLGDNQGSVTVRRRPAAR